MLRTRLYIHLLIGTLFCVLYSACKQKPIHSKEEVDRLFSDVYFYDETAKLHEKNAFLGMAKIMGYHHAMPSDAGAFNAYHYALVWQDLNNKWDVTYESLLKSLLEGQNLASVEQCLQTKASNSFAKDKVGEAYFRNAKVSILTLESLKKNLDASFFWQHLNIKDSFEIHAVSAFGSNPTYLYGLYALTRLNFEFKRKFAMVVNRTIDDILGRGPGSIIDISDPYLDIVSTDGDTIQLGQSYSAVIFLQNLGYAAPNMAIKVNGKSLKLIENKGYFRVQAVKAGAHRYQAVLTLRSPSGKYSAFNREFGFYVKP